MNTLTSFKAIAIEIENIIFDYSDYVTVWGNIFDENGQRKATIVLSNDQLRTLIHHNPKEQTNTHHNRAR